MRNTILAMVWERSICEACGRESAVEAIDSEQPDEPYRLCSGCGKRLQDFALRPLEWFNLAAIHGPWKFFLHDDFYDQQGMAWQPKSDAYATDGLLAPTLKEASHSIDRLIDYCITRLRLGSAEFQAFDAFECSDVLDKLRKRARDGNPDVLVTSLKLAANVLGPVAADWVRGQFERSRKGRELYVWAEAAAKCLTAPEGLRLTIDALAQLESRQLQDQLVSLIWFQSTKALDWIEGNVPSANVTESWGRLASRSDLSWPRVQAWLSKGRPLSLVALDALKECIPRKNASRDEMEPRPVIRDCPERSAICQQLEVYMAADAAPRVTQRGQFVIDRVDELLIV